MKFLFGGLGTGILAGILAGLLGVGGGIVILPMLVYFFHMDQHTAQGTSLAILLPPSGLFAFLSYYRAGHVNMKLAALIIVGVLLGGYLGGQWAQQLSGPILRKTFAVFMVIAAVNMWFKK
ncbi:MAG: permease [Acidobacteria bacterium]|nr:MAG: permease [Acidobacteriota bacterium]